MGIDFVLYVFQQTIFTALLLAAPMLLTGLVIGLMVSIFQSVTQIQEMTLSFIPKILGVAAALILALPWLLRLIISYANFIFEQIGKV